MKEKIFACRRCGYCCQGQTTVSLTASDLERMVSHLGLPVEKVKEKYLRETGNVIQMKTVNGHCIFFEAKVGCTIHPGRPWRCRQWPLHPSILSDPANFQAISSSCPGLNRNLGYEEFCRTLAKIQPENPALD